VIAEQVPVELQIGKILEQIRQILVYPAEKSVDTSKLASKHGQKAQKPTEMEHISPVTV
jgi:hypothetical protein